MKGKPPRFSPPSASEKEINQTDEVGPRKKVKVRDSAYRQARHEARRLARERKECEEKLLEKTTKKNDTQTVDTSSSSSSFSSPGRTLLHTESIRDKKGKKQNTNSSSFLHPLSLSSSSSSSLSVSIGDALCRQAGYEVRDQENLQNEGDEHLRKKEEQRHAHIHGGEPLKGREEEDEGAREEEGGGKRKRKRKRKRKSSGEAAHKIETSTDMNGDARIEEEEEKREGEESEGGEEEEERRGEEKKEKDGSVGVSIEERVRDHGESRSNVGDPYSKIGKKKKKTRGDDLPKGINEKERSHEKKPSESSSSSSLERNRGEEDDKAEAEEEEKEDRHILSSVAFEENTERKERDQEEDEGVGLDDIARLLKHHVSSSSSSLSLAGEKNRGRPDFTRRYCVVGCQEEKEKAQKREEKLDTRDKGGDLHGGETKRQEEEEEKKMRENEEMEEEDQDEVLQSLHPCLVDRLRRTMNIHSLFPVQRKVIGLLKRAIDHPFDPRNCDICVSAPTGEGKTFCYVLPIVDFLLKSVVRTTRCLVITPTRELAIQVAEEFGRFHHYPCPRSLRSVSPHSPSPASSSFMDSHSTACKRKSSDTAPLHHSFCETEGEEEEKMKRKKKKKKRRRDREVDEEERRTDSVEEENGEERISRCRKGETRRDEEDEENNPTSTTTAEETEPDTERDEEEEDESKRRDEEEEREENKVKQKKKKTPGCVEEDCNMKRPRFDPGVISSLQPYHRDFSPPCRGEITVACLVGELTNTTPMISPSSSHPKKSSSSSSFLGWSSHARSPSSFFSPNGFCLPTPHMNLHTSTLSPSFSSSCSSSPPPDVIVCTPGKFTELVENEIKKSSSLRHSPSEEKAGKGQLATCMRRSRRDTFSAGIGSFSLRDVRWIVVDEADRLVRQVYHDWMTALSDLEAFRLNSHMQSLGLETARRASSRFSSSSFSPYADFPDASEMIPACKNSPSSSLPGVKASSSFFSPSMALPLQKLTFSATLTKNPRAIAALSLTRPFFVLSTPTGGYSMPSSLIQRYLVCEESSKPLYLILLLHYLVFYQRRSRWSACDPRESSLQEESSASHLSRATPEDSHGMPKKKTKKKERNGASDQGQEGTDDEEEESEKEGEEEEKKKSDDYGKSPSSSSLPPEKIRAIIFCRSRDETHRLARLLQLHFGRGSDGVHEQVSPELEESSPHRGIGLAFSSLFYPPSSSLRRHTSGDKVEEEEERAAASVDKNEMRRSASTGRDREDSLDVSPPGASRETFNDNDANTQEKEEEKKKIERRKFSEKVVLNVREICSTLSQKQRLKTINQFRRGLIEVIVCSDVAARGLDVDGVKLVCHYDAPQHIQSYIHRSGRSARAGARGLCVTFLSSPQVRGFRDMIKKKTEEAVSTSLKPLHLHLQHLDLAFRQKYYAKLLDSLRSLMKFEAKGLFDRYRPVTLSDLLSLSSASS